MAIVSVSIFAVACTDKAGGHKHVWGEWTLEVEPTWDEPGKATRTCTSGDGVTDTEDNVPALSNSSVWKLDTEQSVPASHTEGGKNVYTSVYGKVEVPTEKEGHVWGAWVFNPKPTLTAPGKVARTCTADDGGVDTEIPVPALSDEDFWTIDSEKSFGATHGENGKDVYVCEYGEVEVEIPAIGHSWGDWTITLDPTLTAKGKAAHSCTTEDGGYEEVEIPELSDSSVWTLSSHTDATYTEPSVDVYTSEYGTVTYYGSVLPAFAKRTYHSIRIDVYNDNGKATRNNSDNANYIYIDENGVGENGTGSPFNSGNTYKFEIKNSETGEMEITRITSSGSSVFKGYLDFDSGIMLMTRLAGTKFTQMYILIPTGEFNATYDSYDGSVWTIGETLKLAITYTYGNGTEDKSDDVVHNIFISGENGDEAYFGVSFKDKSGNAVLGENAYNSSYLYVSDKNGKSIAAYGLKNGKLVEVDGYEGEYDITLNDDITDEGSKIFISGFGTVTLTTDATYDGTYVILENSTYDLLVVIEELNVSYYLVFNGGSSVTLAAVKVTVTLALGDYGTLESLSLEAVPGLALTLPEPTYDENSIVFKGWYYDENFERAVETPFIPLESCTLYAKWTEVPSYAGTYKGENIYGSGMKTPTFTDSNKIVISPKGVVTIGSKTGTVTDYEPEKQLITWVDSSGTTNYFFYDEDTGVIITRFSGTTYEYFNNDIYFYSKYASSAKAYGVNFALPEHVPTISASSPNLKIVELEVDADGTVKTIVIYYNRIYNNVALSDIGGAELTVNNVKDASSLVVRDASTNAVLLALKAVSGTLASSNTVPLDAYFGSYTDNLGKTIVLDGVDGITYDGVAGTYTVASGEAYTITAFVGEGDELAYYEITLNGTSATTVKPNFEIALNFKGVTIGEEIADLIVTNKYVPIVLPTPTDSQGAYIFDGWYTDENLRTPVSLSGGKYTPTENLTLYARWIKKLTVHVHYNNDGVDFEEYWYVGDGKALTLAVPEGIINGVAFDGFYTSADLNEGSKWTNGSVITEADGITDIYVKWSVAVPYYGTYNGKNIHGAGAAPSVSSNYTLSIDANGGVTGHKTGDIEGYNEETGTLTIKVGSSTFIGAVDIVNGVLVYNFSSGGTALNNDILILLRGKNNVNCVSADGSQWNSGITKLVKFTYDGGEMTVFVWNGRVWGNVTAKSANGSVVSAGDAKNASFFSVENSEGEIIAFCKDGEFVLSDGLKGSYTDNFDKTIVLDGGGTITYDGVLGTYTVASGEEYTIAAFVGEGDELAYYEITLNGSFATTVKPEVELSFNLKGVDAVEGQPATANYNKNVPITLPTLTDSSGIYLFVGWFIDDSCEMPVELKDGKYVPLENIVLYAKWVVPVPYYGDYNGWEIYGTGNQPGTYGSNYSISVSVFGDVTGGGKSGTLVEYDEETGALVLRDSSDRVGAFDSKNGVLIFNDSAGGTEIKYDIHVMLRGKTNVALNKTNSSQWKSGVIKLLSMTYDGGEMIVFVWNNRVWGNVIISSVGDTVTAGNAYEASSFTLLDSDGKPIATYKNGAFEASDELFGTYSYAGDEDLGTIRLDGAGGITSSKGSGTYAITEGTTIEVVITVVSEGAHTLEGYTVVINKAAKNYTATTKALDKVTLTIVYAQDGSSLDEQATLEVLNGAQPDLTAFVKTTSSLGWYFTGWFEDSDRQTPYTPSALTANKNIYAGWSAYLLEDLYGLTCNDGGHSKTHYLRQWKENNGAWRADVVTTGSSSLSNSNSYIFKITFATSGTFSLHWEAQFGDSFDGLHIAKNLVSKYPHDYTNSNDGTNEYKVSTSAKSGDYSVSVVAGDVIYIDAFWDAYQSVSGDYAQISNLQFTPAA